MRFSLRRICDLCLPMLSAGLLACGGGGSGGGGNQPPNPTLTFSAVQNPDDFNRVDLTWGVSQSVDGFHLDAKVEGGTYQRLTAELLPPTTVGGRLQFEDSVPERTTFFFLLSAYKSGAAILQTEARFRRTLRPVRSASVQPLAQLGGAVLTWNLDDSSVATGSKLERSDAQGPWTLLNIPAQDPKQRKFTFWDPSFPETGDLRYRIVATADTESGMPVVCPVAPTLLAPAGLKAEADGRGGWKLGWTNRGSAAKSLAIVRQTWNSGDTLWSPAVTLATLTPTAATFTDETPPNATRTAYKVSAVADWNSADSAWCLLGGPSELAALGMGRTVAAPSFPPKLRSADGAWLGWASTNIDGFVRARISRAPTSSAFPRDITMPANAAPYAAFQAYGIASPTGGFDFACWSGSASGSSNPMTQVQFHHLFGGTWRSSATAEVAESLYNPSFAADGILRWCNYGPNPAIPRPGFAWLGEEAAAHQEEVALLGVGAKSQPILGAGGRVHVFVQSSGGWSLATREANGAWAAEPIPGLGGDFWTQCQGAFADPQGGLHAVFNQPIPNGLRYLYFLKPPSGPSVQTVLLDGAYPGWGTQYSYSHSDDWSRLGFVMLDDAGHLRVLLRNQDGRWSDRSAIVPDARDHFRQPLLMTGFLQDNRFWIAHDKVSLPGWDLSRAFDGAYLEVLEEK